MSSAPTEAPSNKTAIFGVLAGALLLFFVPTVLAVVLYMTLRRTIGSNRKLYYWVMGVGALASLVLTFTTWEYFRYIFEFLASRILPDRFPDFSPFGSFPYLSVVTYTASIFGTVGLLAGKLVNFSPKLAQKLQLDDTIDDDDFGPLMPDEETRREVSKLVAFPTDGPTGGTKRRAKRAGAATRDQSGVGVVPVGLDAHGRTVQLFEPDMTVHGQILGSTGSGKALGLDTPIPTPDGWTTMGDLKVGDLVFDERGKPTRVVFATETQLNRDCFEVVFSDGSVIIADADHRWLVEDRRGRSSRNNRRADGGVGYAPWDRRDERFLERLDDPQLAVPSEATLQEIIGRIGHDKFVYETVRSRNVSPLRSEVRFVAHQYGSRTVKKRHTREIYSVPEVFAAMKEAVQERMAAREPVPVERVVTTREMKDALLRNGARNWAIRVAQPLELPERDLPMDPYLLGCWLGDGDSYNPTITSADPEVHAAFESKYERGKLNQPSGQANTISYLDLRAHLRSAGVLGNKHIPAEYLRASYAQRLALLQGLMDTDGTIHPNGAVEFCTTNPRLAEGFAELLGTLGLQARPRRSKSFLYGVRKSDRYRFTFTTNLPIFRLPRKAQRLPAEVRGSTQYRFVTDIRPVESVPVRCIQVDSPSHLYLAGRNFIPTHNTEALKRVIAGLMDLGWEGTIVDLKEDIGEGGLGQWVEAYARSHTIPFQSWGMSFSHYRHYLNPLEGLHPDLALNAIIATQDFEAPHWAAQAEQILGQLLTLLYDAHEVAPDRFPQPTLKDIARMLSGNIAENTKSRRAVIDHTLIQSGQRSRDDYLALYNPNQTQAQAANGMAARIGRIFESELGRTGLAPGPGRDPLDVVAPGVVYVGLDELGQPYSSAMLAALILARFGGVASEAKHAPVRRRRFLVIDEAASADHALLLNLLKRARSAGLALIVATQSAKDWGEDWGELVQNINWTMVMRQNDPESALMVADLIGKQTVQTPQVSQRLDERGYETGGTVSYRDVESYRVDPENLRALQTGESIVYVGKRYNALKPFVRYCRVVQRHADELPEGVELETKARDNVKQVRNVGDVWEYPDFTAGTAKPDITPFPLDDGASDYGAPPPPPPPPRRPH